MSGNVMKKVELNYEKESMIYRYLDSFVTYIKVDNKENKEKLARETIEVMELVATQNAIKAEETKKEIKSEVLEDIRKEMVTKDYVSQQFQATKDYIDQKFQAERDYVNQRFDYVDQQFKATKDYVSQQFQASKDYVDVKITRAKYGILILVGIILASVISAGYVYVNDVKTELKEDIRRIEDTNQKILDILISQSKKD